MHGIVGTPESGDVIYLYRWGRSGGDGAGQQQAGEQKEGAGASVAPKDE